MVLETEVSGQERCTRSVDMTLEDNVKGECYDR